VLNRPKQACAKAHSHKESGIKPILMTCPAH